MRSLLTPNSRLVLAVFAVFRVARFIAIDEGPAVPGESVGVFEQMRTRLGANDLGPDGEPDTPLGRGISCPYCIGVYAAALAAVVFVWPNRVGDALLLWLGLSGAQSVLEDQGDKH